MSFDVAIKVAALSKCYHIYDRPRDRLLQMLARNRKQFFREFWALRDVSLEIKKGAIVGIIGRNGSGKSTLLQLICGTLNPTSGSVMVEGRVAALLELGAGFNPEFTGVENVFMAASLYGLSREQVSARFDAIASFADIGEKIHQPVKTYSSGMYVRLAFAVIANVDADVLIVDEALAVGDVFFVQKCMRYLRSFARTGTLLFVSHDSAAVLSLCDTAILLDAGRVERTGTPKAVTEYYLQKQHAEVAGGGPQALEDQEGVAASVPTDLRRDTNDFGAGGARIVNAALCDSQGLPYVSFVGGERTNLDIRVRIEREVAQPIVGFFVKNRHGQGIFGANSSELLEGGIPLISEGKILCVRFGFVMPKLSNGEYSITIAVATGTLDNHTQLDWIHDSVIFTVAQPKNRNAMIEIDFDAFDVSVIDEQQN